MTATNARLVRLLNQKFASHRLVVVIHTQLMLLIAQIANDPRSDRPAMIEAQDAP